MILKQFPDLMLDEYPTEKSDVSMCIFTRPVFPVPDLTKLKNKKIKIFCTEATYHVLTGFRDYIPEFMLYKLPEYAFMLEFHVEIIVEAIPTGSPNGSVMLLLEFEGKSNEKALYTGQFTRCNEVLAHKIIHMACRKNSITDLYIDNTIASASHPNSVSAAAQKIADIINKYPDCKINLEVELFGYEELFVELAEEFEIKVALHAVQMRLFRKTNKIEAFEGCNHDEAKVRVRIKQQTYSLDQYKTMFKKANVITIKPIRVLEDQKVTEFESEGFFCVPYVPNASPTQIWSLIQTIEPKRLHLLYHDDLNTCTRIPKTMINREQTEVLDLNGNRLEATDGSKFYENLTDTHPASQQSVFSPLFIDSTLADDLHAVGPVKQTKQTKGPLTKDQSKKIAAEKLLSGTTSLAVSNGRFTDAESKQSESPSANQENVLNNEQKEQSGQYTNKKRKSNNEAFDKMDQPIEKSAASTSKVAKKPAITLLKSEYASSASSSSESADLNDPEYK